MFEASDKNTDQSAELREFFIPDLCTPRLALISVALTEALVLLYVLTRSSPPSFDWNLMAVTSLFVMWVVLLSTLLLCWLRAPLSRAGLPLATVYSLLIVGAVTAFCSVSIRNLFSGIIDMSPSSWWIARNILVACVLAAIVLRVFYLQQQLRKQEQLELQARLESLQAKIKPHFLFNTLNTIASLIASQPATAERVMEDIAELFRASLTQDNAKTSVSDELRLTEMYLGIEQLRLGDRLCVQWRVDETAKEKSMPPLVLQPLLENAIYHGIARIPEGGEIEIGVRHQAGFIRVSVENPVPQQESIPSGHHMALLNIEQRLKAIYGEDAALVTTRHDNRFRVELSYQPLKRL